jgi:hypothetical protein
MDYNKFSELLHRKKLKVTEGTQQNAAN